MSEKATQESPQEAPLSLDLAGCMRVLVEQQRKSEEAARVKQANAEALQREVQRGGRAMAAHVLAQLPAALEQQDDGVGVEVPHAFVRELPPKVLECMLSNACTRLDAYFGFNEVTWMFLVAGPHLVVDRGALTTRIKQMASLPAADQAVEAEDGTRDGGSGVSIVREAVGDEKPSVDKGPRCKGAWAIGNNCKTCWRCLETKPAQTEDPFVPGLPPLQLREVWAEWLEANGGTFVFTGDKYRLREWKEDDSDNDIGDHDLWMSYKFRPHGKTRAEVEAMAVSHDG